VDEVGFASGGAALRLEEPKDACSEITRTLLPA
jgi:hypothetical protein